MNDEYLVVGRICDYEDHFKLVIANSNEEAGNKFEKYVRGIDGIEGGEFYIEHCQKIQEMKLHSVN